ncbi:mannan endo-1,6-alpha-mannosidase [Rhizodiscina lignyota]|uniref:Mannan endo-1,6-alpha-mannosidase n=1 Tax=Rhizodiscina lignyota TaxID=1504668 RepID=A0A9P4IDS3_9PEZI|nr:mannan endo-1,6-alpha-mannosidase [Rhizodiscina lignyota]
MVSLRIPLVAALVVAGLAQNVAQAIDLDLNNTDSIKAAASTVADGMMKFYIGNLPGQTPGLLQPPYYWWEAGAMWGQLIEYWHYTGDSTYNDVVQEALLFQSAPTKDYMPVNQTKSEGNDDQLFWAFAVMSAAETLFPNPPQDQPQWLALAQAVFNQQISRWNPELCGGGLRWQIYNFNIGWNYKNAISNGGLFQLSARLARYTLHQTYADWAEKVYDWMAQSPIMVTNSSSYDVYDGVTTDHNCSAADVEKVLWTYNIGTMINGCAYMYNYQTNGSNVWAERLNGFINGSSVYFPNGDVMDEISMDQCQVTNACTQDQPSYRAYLARWLATTTQMAPYTFNHIAPLLQASAKGAAGQCSGGDDGKTCGRNWTSTEWDGYTGVGEQMSALSVIQSNLVSTAAAPAGQDNGGTSEGDPGAGIVDPNVHDMRPITTVDKAGSWVLTGVMLLVLMAGAISMGYGDD